MEPRDENGNGQPVKLHGRAFYESLGSPKFILAPMVDQSEFAWRMLSRSYMTPETTKSLLAYTPMLHARMFTETTKFRDNHFQPTRASLASKPTSSALKGAPLYLDGNPAIDRPLFVQFCANNPDELLEASRYVEPFCDAVDLNLGCPQGIARKGQYGAFLQENPDLIYDLINKLHHNLNVPITAKIRVLETREKTLEYAKKVLDAGASILTVHGRQREQKGHKTGMADWSIIRFLRESLPKDTVIFANGNILRRKDIDDCLEATGADGVMSAEGNLYDPTIFSEAPEIGQEGREYWRGIDGRGGFRIDSIMRRYMDILYKYVLEVEPPARKPLFITSDLANELPEELTVQAGLKRGREDEDLTARKKQKGGKQERTSNPNLVAMQPHLFHLLRPLVKKHHNIRDALAKSRAGDIAAFEEVLQMTETVVRDALIQYDADGGKSATAEMESDDRLAEKKPDPTLAGYADYESSVETVRDCKRPWWIAQPYVRPLPAEALQKGSLRLSKKDMKKLQEKRTLLSESEAPVDAIGHVKSEPLNEHGGPTGEQVEVPKEGLVCG